MSDGTASFRLELSADLGAAAGAAGQLDMMRVAMQKDVQELNQLKAAMAQMKAGGQQSSAAYQAMGDKAKAMSARILTGG